MEWSLFLEIFEFNLLQIVFAFSKKPVIIDRVTNKL